MKKDLITASPIQQPTAIDFAGLLKLVAEAQPYMRIRFSTSNPQDMSDNVLHTIATYDNICNYIPLPVQSGSTRILKEMNRQHPREKYIKLIDTIRRINPYCSITHDMIMGFTTENYEDHKQTRNRTK